MKAAFKLISVLLLAVLLGGCMQTVDQMYCPPKRSDAYNDLQSAMDSALNGLSYAAPVSGENQQSVQMADLDGDGVNEYLLFAKSTQAENPLRIFVFHNIDGKFENTDTVECNGSAFDQVEYADLDGNGGMEIIVGRQISDQVIRSVSVYTLNGRELTQQMTVNYARFLTVDMNGDGLRELFVLRPGQTEADNGAAELYSMKNSTMERYNEVEMSQPVDSLKRILVGKLQGGQVAVYTACAVGETALTTDVFALNGELLLNVGHTTESDTGVQTLRNFYVYADDIDDDGVVELPRLITMQGTKAADGQDTNQLICWYALDRDGNEHIKMYTYHNFVGGWYMQLGNDWADRVAVIVQSNEYALHIWDKAGINSQKIAAVYVLSGQNREEQAAAGGNIILHRTDTVVYVATLEPYAKNFGLDEQTVKNSFRLIQHDWKTGET